MTTTAPEGTGLPDPRRVPTLSVEQAARLAYGLGRSGAYAAAARGDLPTIKIGSRLRVPTALLYERLNIPIPA